MNYSIVLSTKTGNAGILAERIKDVLKDNLLYFGEPCNDVPESDILFVGFWTNMGTCNSEIADYLKTLNNKKIFLFGTAGFGLSQDYFDTILSRVKENINDSNTIVDTFMCQGKMGLAVREKYERLKESDNPPPNIDMLIANFDEALMHPSADDLIDLTRKLLALKDN